MAHLKKVVWLLLVVGFVGAVVLADDEATTEPPTSESHSEAPRKSSKYAFAFETENGQVRDENIVLDPSSTSSKMEVNIKGSYSFISADGYEYTVFYKADKKGFRPYVTAHKIKTEKDKPQ